MSPEALASQSLFTPNRNDVLVNSLWFASLSLSLLSAFFAIAVQQWLHSLVPPNYLLFWNAIRLRQRRYRNSMRFQLQNIITLLPAFLQISVILFLLGLYFMLEGLNHMVATIYMTLTGPPVMLYIATLFLSLIWIDCPFKSPLVPSIAFLFRWIKILFLLLSLYAVIIPAALVVNTLQMYEGIRRQVVTKNIVDIIAQVAATLRFRITASRSPPAFQTLKSEFWTEREVRELYRTARTFDGAMAMEDYKDALAQAPQTTRNIDMDTVQTCLRSLPPRARARCVLTWVYMYFGSSSKSSFMNSYNYRKWSPISPRVVEQVDASFAGMYQDNLIQALPSAKELRNASVYQVIDNIEDLSSIFILLTQLVAIDNNAESEPHLWSQLSKKLLTMCEAQASINSSSIRINTCMYMHVPMSCLFSCINVTNLSRGSVSENSKHSRVAVWQVVVFLLYLQIYSL